MGKKLDNKTILKRHSFKTDCMDNRSFMNSKITKEQRQMGFTGGKIPLYLPEYRLTIYIKPEELYRKDEIIQKFRDNQNKFQKEPVFTTPQ